MNIDSTAFTPASAALGGALVGVAAALFILGNGRIAGISGLLASALRAAWRGASQRDGREGVLFLAGLLAAPLLWRVFAPLPLAHVDVGPALLVTAGLLVGFGTRLGGGCTSGHGVCGVSRLSPRSLLGTLLFTAAGFVTVFLLRHLP